MSFPLVSPLEQPNEEFTPTTVEYEVQRFSGNIRPESIHRQTLYKNFRTPLGEARAKVIALLEWPEGWNGYDVAAPNPRAVSHAFFWVRDMYEDALRTGRRWRTPHVAADEDGDVMFRWRNRQKGLSIFVSEEDTSYIRDWGVNIANEMDDGEASTSESRRMLWVWLTD